MMNKSFNIKFLSASTLKILACLFMLCDHIGYMLLPTVSWLRVVGRLAYPIFAYFIAVGCRYTKNRPKRFLSVFILGVICELFYIIFARTYYGNILLTFSVSILLIYLLDEVKKSFCKSRIRFALLLCAFALLLVAVYFYCEYVGLDYGFFGVMAPIFATVLDGIGKDEKRIFNIDRQLVSVCLFSVGLLLTVFYKNALDCQAWCLLSIPLLLMYNGERGKYNLKYAFYLFYPLHLVVLQLIAILVNMKA